MRCPSCSKDFPDESPSCPQCGAAVDDLFSPTVTDDRAAAPLPTPPRSFSASSAAKSSAATGFTPGTTIAGRYRVITLLGKGGMGEVYRADDLTLNEQVALKFLPRALTADPEALSRFHGEVRIARQIAHPNVCRVFDVGEAEGRIFLTMAYIDGEDLASLLRRIGRLPSDKAIELSRQLCAGLAAAHEAGVLHRDLKPANIMVDSRGRAHITDFGVAGLASELAGDTSRAGTPAYMAPEQLAGRGVSVRSDIYSLGLILYEMFTGKRAFTATTIQELQRVQEDSAPSRPSTLVGDVDPLVERVILRCLDHDVNARPASAFDVARALPGGDPLAQALAAGETPSPEMVAASGGEGALSLRTAWMLLAGVMVCLTGTMLLQPWASDLGLAPLNKPPEVLTDRARDLIRKFGYQDKPRDWASWFTLNYEFLGYRAKHLPKSQPFGALQSAEQGHSRFFYRQSPLELFSTNFGPTVGYSDPPMAVAGMVMLALEPNGELLFFEAVPPQKIKADAPATSSAGAFDSPPAPEPDWSAVIKESGLDANRFQPESPFWLPRVPFDTEKGWRGSYEQSPGTVIHLVGASYQGRLVYFDTIPPWLRAERDVAPANPHRFLQLAAFSIILSLFGMSLVLAWRNLRLGRGDQKGAVRLAVFIFCLDLAGWVLRAHHVSSPQQEWMLFVGGVAFSLWAAALAGMTYLALEPFVRRRWPHALTSWVRALAGRYSDPLVGRDLLIGVLLAAFAGLVFTVENSMLVWFNLRGETSQSYDGAVIASLARAGSFILINSVTAIVYALGITLLVFLLRVLLRRAWLAELVAIAIAGPLFFGGTENPWLDIPAGLLLVSIVVLSCSRLGVLALASFYVVLQILLSFPLTLDVSRWYFNESTLGIAFCLGAAFYGFRKSLAGKPIFGTISVPLE